MNSKLLALVAAGGLLGGHAYALDHPLVPDLVEYDFEGGAASGGAATDGVPSLVSGGSATNFALANVSLQNYEGVDGEFGAGNWIISTSPGGDNFNFAYTPTNQTDLTWLSFDERRVATGPRDLAVQYKVGAGSIQTLATIALSTTTATTNREFDLSGVAALQDVVGQQVTFYLTAYRSGSETSANRWVVDDVLLEGAQVPEPAAISLLGLGATALLRRRRA